MAQERFCGVRSMPDVVAQWRAYFQMLDLCDGARVLDVGCHEGDAIALLLSEHPEISRVVGLDRNERKVEFATTRFTGEERVAIVRGDIGAAPFPDGTFDRIYCADTLEWVDDAETALREMRRLLSSGGIALAIHTDFDTQVFASDDIATTRELVHAFTDQGRRGTIGRDLLGLCRAAGFARVEPVVRPLVGTSLADDRYPRRIVDMMQTWLIGTGNVDAGRFEKWVRDLEARDADGRFFYSVNRNICICSN